MSIKILTTLLLAGALVIFAFACSQSETGSGEHNASNTSEMTESRSEGGGSESGNESGESSGNESGGESSSSESGERSGSESGNSEGGEHGAAGEGSEGGSEGGNSQSRENDLKQTLAPGDTYDKASNGVHLYIEYDPVVSTFIGVAQNRQNTTLTRVRIEIHLNDGTELGPTILGDLTPNDTMSFTLETTVTDFTSWSVHAETGSGEGGSGGEGSESGGGNEGAESGSGHAEGGETGEGGDPASPVLSLTSGGWVGSIDGLINGLDVTMTYHNVERKFIGVVTNTSSQTICRVLLEINLKQGTRTVAELGPQDLGDLSPDEGKSVSLDPADEQKVAGMDFDGWQIHPEQSPCP